MSRHKHRCATAKCPHYYVCTQRDCRTDWTCPMCEDNELFNDIQQMDAQSRAAKEPTSWQS